MRLFLRFISVAAIALVLADPASGSAASATGQQPGDLGTLIEGIKRQKALAAPAQSKVSSALSAVLAEVESRGITRANARARNAQALSNRLVHLDPDANLQVHIHLSEIGEPALAALRRYEAEIEIVNEELVIVQAWVPFDRIGGLAALPFVSRITAPKYATPKVGSATTEGDAILKAADLRGLGFNGSGVRVGVISNGANNRAAAQASGDLPPGITIFGTCDPFFFGIACDEGTAVMEILHDIAPGAQLGFGASETNLDFIQRVTDLVDTFGAHIVVDDLGFFGEPYFADGPVAQAAAAVADKVLFVSAAGNSALGHYEANYVGKFITRTGFESLFGFPGTLQINAQDFGSAAGGSSDPTMNLRIKPGAGLLVFLQWNDRFGASSNDYDLYLVNQAENDLLCNFLFCSSTQFQTGFQDPLEIILFVNQTGSTVRGKIVIDKFSGQNRRLEMFIVGDLERGVIIEQYNKPGESVFGHPAVPKVFAVGAIDALDSGHDTIEPYSSQGPARIDYPSLQNRRKPDITGIDNVRVSGAGGFLTRFPGTSAAAPHIAGIAALLKQRFISAKPARLKEALESSAVDLGAVGPDNVFGWGRADATAAFAFLKDALGKSMPWLLLLLVDE